MPAYNSFNLATQGRNGQPNVTTNYYNAIRRPTPVGDQLGNQNATATPAAGAGWQQGQDALPYLQQYLNNRNPYGRSGFNLENSLAGISSNAGRIDPRLYNYGYTQVDQSEGGSERYFQGNANVNQRGHITRNGQIYAQVGEALDRIIDPTKVQYDEEFGLITDPSNIHMPERALDRAMPYVVAAGLGIPTAMHAIGAAGAAGSASTIATPSAGSTLGTTGLPGGVASGVAPAIPGAGGTITGVGGLPAAGVGGGTAVPFAGSTAPGLATGGAVAAGGTAASTMGPVTGTMGYEGAAGAAGGTAASSLPFGLTARDLATGASGVFNLINSRRSQQQTRDAANRADTWGEDGRQFAKEQLLKLMQDPSSIENTPGYKFAQSQGEQGINRAAAGKGYFRSPNMLFDLSQFNQGLATKTWNDEWNKYAKMAGIEFNPSAAANIEMNGNQQSNNMRAAGISQIGSSFFDWLSRTA